MPECDLLVGSHHNSELDNFYGPRLCFTHLPYSLSVSCEGSTACEMETERAVTLGVRSEVHWSTQAYA